MTNCWRDRDDSRELWPLLFCKKRDQRQQQVAIIKRGKKHFQYERFLFMKRLLVCHKHGSCRTSTHESARSNLRSNRWPIGGHLACPLTSNRLLQLGNRSTRQLVCFISYTLLKKKTVPASSLRSSRINTRNPKAYMADQKWIRVPTHISTSGVNIELERHF